MRYRPFGRSGLQVSAISLCVPDSGIRDGERVKLIIGAMENGVSGFEVRAGAEAAITGLGTALNGIDHNLVVIGARIGHVKGEKASPFGPEAIRSAIQGVLAKARLQKLDYVILENPKVGELSTGTMGMLDAAKRARRLGLIGLSGEAEHVDAFLPTGAFDLLAAPYNVRSGWADRNRIKAALNRDMTVLGRDFFSISEAETTSAPPPRPKGLARLFAGRAEPKPESGYEFLARTRNWTAEEICLAYALTEPGLASVQVATTSVDQLKALGEATERELPSGLPAQIEMARFSEAPAQRQA